MIIYHGTSKVTIDNVLSKGFDNSKWIMFADKKEEALRYARSYAKSDNSIPYLIIVDISNLNINYEGKLAFNHAQNLFKAKVLDGYLSDKFERNNLSDYYVIFNIDKLNELNFGIEEIK